MKKSKFKTENTFNGKKMSKKQSEILRKALKDPNIKIEYADNVIIEIRPLKKN